MKNALAVLFLVPSLVLADGHNKPKPPPVPKPVPPPVTQPTAAPQSYSSGDSAGLAVAVFAAAVVGVAIYESRDKKQKLTLVPSQDGKGATANVELRF